MNKLFCFVSKTMWTVFQFTLTVGMTVFVLSIVPMIFIALMGLIGLALAAQISFMVILNSPYFGFALAVLFFMGVVAVTVLAIALLILILILAVSFIALPMSLIIQDVLRRQEIKSRSFHMIIYSFFGALAGTIFSLVPLLIMWTSLKELQYAEVAITAIIVALALSGVLSVNTCGITFAILTKIKNFFLKIIFLVVV